MTLTTPLIILKIAGTSPLLQLSKWSLSPQEKEALVERLEVSEQRLQESQTHVETLREEVQARKSDMENR